MRKLLTLFLILTAVAVDARHISADEAAAIASEFLNSPAISPAKHIGVNRVKPKSDASVNQDSPYYIFNGDDNSGFVIISGDDRMKKILGFSDTGSFDFDNIPPQLAHILDLYAEQIYSLNPSDITDSSWNISDFVTSTNDGVLLQTSNWGQWSPYNLQAPVVNEQQCPSGCVATAMAIVMNFHKWPNQAKGEGCYFGYLGGYDDCHTNFSDYNFDYEVLNNSDDNLFPSEISKLLYACGRAVNTIYFPDGSGAMPSVIGYGMARYFCYSNDFKYVKSTDFSDEEWMELICEEIDNGRPIIYTLNDRNHTVVCDGYRNNSIHINWGWDGIDNGYFDLAAIRNEYDDMIINIKPENRTEEIGDIFIDSGITVPMIDPYDKGIKTNVSKIEKDIPFDLYIETLITDNRGSHCDYGWMIGIGLVDKENNIKEIISEISLPWNYYNDDKLKAESFFCSVNGHLGIKSIIYDNIIHADVESTDKLQLLTIDSQGEWIKVTGIDCDSYISTENPPCELSQIEIDSNIPIENFLPHKSLPTKSFKGVPISQFIKKVQDNDGRINLHYFTVDGMNRHRMNGGNNSTDFYGSWNLSKDLHKIKIRSIERDMLVTCQIQTNSGGEVRNLIESSDLEMDKINELKISGYVNSEDLFWVYNFLPALEYLDLSETETTEKIRFDNLMVSAPFLAEGQYGNLTFLKMPKNSSEIPENTFAYFEPLEILYIPSGVGKIGSGAFQGANTLRHLCFESEVPCVLDNMAFGFGDDSEYYYEKIALHVPSGSKSAYEMHPEWGKFHHITEDDLTIRLDIEEWACKVGEFVTVTSKILQEDAADNYVIWSSSDEDVAIVDQYGKVTAVKEGTATITACYGSHSAKCEINVIPTLVESIELEDLTLYVSEISQLVPKIFPYTATNKTIVWQSNNPEAVSIDADGKVTACAVGDAIITAFAKDDSGVTGSCKIKVLPVIAESIIVNPLNWTGLEGESFTISATVLPENTTDKSVSWVSSDTDVATVDENGNVEILKGGQCTITARTLDGSDLSAECIITSEAGIDAIFTDATAEFDIYDIQGILIKKSCHSDDLKQMTTGAYILRQGDIIRKLVIR